MGNSGNSQTYIKDTGENVRFNRYDLLLTALIVLQMSLALALSLHTSASGDAVFTFTLANTPYSFNYIDSKIDRFPGENGWFDAGILKEQYMAESYDRFNYSGVYWHQRIDNHPLLYYSLVHTICSLFPDTYNIMYALVINLAALLLIDLLLIRISDFLFGGGGGGSACVVLIAVTSIVTLLDLVRTARMYILLALMCVWFLWICLKSLDSDRGGYAAAESPRCNLSGKKETGCRRRRSSAKSGSGRDHLYLELFICVLAGSQTHYYFYVYAALLAVIVLIFLILDRSWRRILWSAVSGIMALCTSLILFPWVVWAIVFNQMDKPTTLHLWNMGELQSWAAFVNENVFNGRWYLVLIAAAAAVGCLLFKRNGRKFSAAGRTDKITSVPPINDVSGKAVSPDVGSDSPEFHDPPVGIPASAPVASAQGRPVSRHGYLKTWILIILSALLYSVVIYTLNGGVAYYATPVYIPAALGMAGIAILIGRSLLQTDRAQTIAAAIIVILMLGSVTEVYSFIENVVSEYVSYRSFHAAAKEYEGADCIYVANGDDNLLGNLWFEFGRYDEFKRIYAEDYPEDGTGTEWEQILAGRETENAVVIYLPADLSVPEGGEIVASSRDWREYNIVIIDAE